MSISPSISSPSLYSARSPCRPNDTPGSRLLRVFTESEYGHGSEGADTPRYTRRTESPLSFLAHRPDSRYDSPRAKESQPPVVINDLTASTPTAIPSAEEEEDDVYADQEEDDIVKNYRRCSLLAGPRVTKYGDMEWEELGALPTVTVQPQLSVKRKLKSKRPSTTARILNRFGSTSPAPPTKVASSTPSQNTSIPNNNHSVISNARRNLSSLLGGGSMGGSKTSLHPPNTGSLTTHSDASVGSVDSLASTITGSSSSALGNSFLPASSSTGSGDSGSSGQTVSTSVSDQQRLTTPKHPSVLPIMPTYGPMLGLGLGSGIGLGLSIETTPTGKRSSIDTQSKEETPRYKSAYSGVYPEYCDGQGVNDTSNGDTGFLDGSLFGTTKPRTPREGQTPRISDTVSLSVSNQLDLQTDNLVGVGVGTTGAIRLISLDDARKQQKRDYEPSSIQSRSPSIPSVHSTSSPVKIETSSTSSQLIRPQQGVYLSRGDSYYSMNNSRTSFTIDPNPLTRSSEGNNDSNTSRRNHRERERPSLATVRLRGDEIRSNTALCVMSEYNASVSQLHLPSSTNSTTSSSMPEKFLKGKKSIMKFLKSAAAVAAPPKMPAYDPSAYLLGGETLPPTSVVGVNANGNKSNVSLSLLVALGKSSADISRKSFSSDVSKEEKRLRSNRKQRETQGVIIIDRSPNHAQSVQSVPSNSQSQSQSQSNSQLQIQSQLRRSTSSTRHTDNEQSLRSPRSRISTESEEGSESTLESKWEIRTTNLLPRLELRPVSMLFSSGLPPDLLSSDSELSSTSTQSTVLQTESTIDRLGSGSGPGLGLGLGIDFGPKSPAGSYTSSSPLPGLSPSTASTRGTIPPNPMDAAIGLGMDIGEDRRARSVSPAPTALSSYTDKSGDRSTVEKSEAELLARTIRAELLNARKMWLVQISELQAQVRELKLDLEKKDEVEKGGKKCETCGCECGKRLGVDGAISGIGNSIGNVGSAGSGREEGVRGGGNGRDTGKGTGVMDRGRAKTGGARGVFGSGSLYERE
ncbi:hypothetical protein M231_07794 [Tremella mesenterica]|uniref:Uncharacterized protein n=1 Tax=Tremella mesenterica TaxID=5217 RepID=A0A4Q1B888_TREME|nr:uncharacterized protein TREMEDRAFT_62576 [Tremella mesenterica DSM 1558]EIW69707.1 hypothetical protein TREMEDRAFT_62576 [Tremella mesenterica DSM 1558]RXK34948.1 hypothetical protein M231_07794 [Tremella mesenterica]